MNQTRHSDLQFKDDGQKIISYEEDREPDKSDTEDRETADYDNLINITYDQVDKLGDNKETIETKELTRDELIQERGVSTVTHVTDSTKTLNKESTEEVGKDPGDKPTEFHQYSNPVDHGWAWVVLLGCFGIAMLIIGGLKTFGVLYVELAKKYKVSNQALSSVQSLTGFCYLFFAPVCNALSTRFTHRLVIFIGAIMTSTGLILSSLAPSVAVLFLTYGLITGIGYSMCFSSMVVMVANYFKKYRSFASGFALSGGGFGAMTLPYLIRYFMNQYGLEGAMLIYAGIMSHGCVFAMLLRPFTSYPHKNKTPKSSSARGERELHLLIKEEKRLENCPKSEIKTSKTFNRRDSTSDNGDSVWLPHHHVNDTESNKLCPQNHFDRRLHLSSASLDVLAASISCQSLASPPSITNYDTKKNNSFLNEIKWKLLLNPVFAVFVVLVFFSMVSYHSLFNVVPPFADELGLSGEDGALVLLIFGATDLTGRIAFGVLMDIFPKRRHIIFTVCVAFGAVGVILTPLFRSLLTLSLFMAAYGCFAGGYNGTLVIILVDKVGLKLLPSAWGFSCLAASIAMLINPWASGLIKDSTGTWAHALHFTGSTSILAVLLLLALPLIERRYNLSNDSIV